ncbi:cytochrome P450 4c21-like [Ochlerotatus camptorhynchus]|uniref:cytochrome P450 4c21-like n=1 Tax=Ochlerotatus camptorhynchus TaxID=644619 RepID=UPI0031DACE70
MIVLAVIVGLIFCLLYLSQRRRYKFADSLPQLKQHYPVLGNGAMMFGKDDVQRFAILVKIFHDHDRLVRVWAGPKMLLFTCHPDLVQQILTSSVCLEKPFLYSFAGFEHGLFTSKYKLWRTTRKRLNSSFNLRILHGFIPIFVQCARKMVDNLNENPDGATVSMHKYTSVCTLEMACGTTLGSDITKREGKEEFVDGLDIAFGEAARRMVSVHLYPNIVYRLTKYHYELLHARKVVCDFFNRLVTERRVTLGLCNNSKTIEEVDEDHKPKILIDKLLSVSQDGKNFSETEINDNIYAVITGANDTSGLLIAHACLFLCFYKDIEEKLYTEIMEFMPTEEADINPDSLKQLVYMEKFLKECLRHCPVAPNISRENMAEIEIDGVKVPPGNIFVMNFYALHRRKDLWGPDAEKFDPEQFSEERSQNRHPFAYLPFSGGNRICIGWRYAMLSMKVMLIYLIRNFQFETKIRPEDVRYRHDLTMKLPFDHMIKVTKRCTGSMNVTGDILRAAPVQKAGRD